MTIIKSTVLSISIHRADKNPVFGEGVTHVSLQDDAAGPFIEIRQSDVDAQAGLIRIEMEGLEAITEAARKLMKGWPGENE